MNLPALIYRFDKQLQQLQPRERVLGLITLFILLAAVSQGILYLLDKRDPQPIIDAIDQTNQEIKINQQAIISIQERQNKPSLRQLELDIEQLKQKLTEIEQQIELSANYLIPADQMVPILKDLLKSQKSLTIQEFRTQAPVQLEDVSEQLPLFRHGLNIRLTGNFIAIGQWLKAIEELPWVLNWDQLDYQIGDWPEGELNIRLHTLSREDKWLDL